MTNGIGSQLFRADGVEKVNGQGRYTADLTLPGMAHAAFLYAGRPAARIVDIDVTAAETMSGVLAVVTHRDVPDRRFGSIIKDRRLFAKDAVRFEGEVVAGVAAVSAELAREACRAIRVDYEDTKPVLDSETAIEPNSPLIHPDWEAYEAPNGSVREGNSCSRSTITKGDVDLGFAQADVIVEGRYVADMSHPAPIEPHAVLAQWQGERLTVWSTSQVPFVARWGISEALALPESAIRVIVPLLGGGFGGKCDVHFEPHVAALARKAGRPVRLVLGRREEFTATDMVRHAIVTEIRTGVRRDGTITAVRAKLVLDTGAYAAHGPACADTATMMAAGPYRIPNLLIEANAVYTNRTPAGSTRAPTGPQVCWAIEQHMDAIAERLEISPVELRLRNLVGNGDLGPTGQTIGVNGARQCVEKATELIDWSRPNKPGEGVGISCGWWFNYPMTAGCHCTLNPDGTLTIITGAQENGSGAVMGLALIAAEELGLDADRIAIRYQDTDIGPWDMGSQGSQTTFNVGRALVEATGEVRRQLVELAAEELEISPEDLQFVDGHVRVKGMPDRAMSIPELAGKAWGRRRLLLGSGSPPAPVLPPNDGASACTGRVTFPAFLAPSFYCHAARVEVDQETGVVRVLEVAAVHDFGRVINPLGAEGQVEGGVVHATGMALSEGTKHVAGRQLNPSFLDYKLQTTADAPRIKVAFIDAPDNDGGPYGLKGVGEPPVVPTAGAIANAIARAIGARMHMLPMTPDRIWRRLKEIPL